MVFCAVYAWKLEWRKVGEHGDYSFGHCDSGYGSCLEFLK